VIRHVHHDGHQLLLSPGERKKKMVSQSPQKTSSSVPATCTRNIISELRYYRRIPGKVADPYLFFNNYNNDTTHSTCFFYQSLPFRQNNAIRNNNALTPTPNATDPTIPTLLITPACSAALRFAVA
jgi:hypothetical protein